MSHLFKGGHAKPLESPAMSYECAVDDGDATDVSGGSPYVLV